MPESSYEKNKTFKEHEFYQDKAISQDLYRYSYYSCNGCCCLLTFSIEKDNKKGVVGGLGAVSILDVGMKACQPFLIYFEMLCPKD